MTIGEAWQRADRPEKVATISVAFASAVSLIFSIVGFPAVGHDSDVHLNWLEQFSRLFVGGIGYPRWLPDSNWGFGSTTFYFYPPLPYWFGGLIRFVLPFVPTPFYNLVTLVATLGSIWTVAILLSEYTDNPLRKYTAALFYSFVAYRFADAFIRDALGEHWALTFLPLLFVNRASHPRTLIIRTIGWIGIIFSSIPVLVLAGISIVAWHITKRIKREFIIDAIAVILALIIGAAYLLPAIMLKQLVHTEHLISPSPATTGFAIVDLLVSKGWLRFLCCATLVGSAVVFIQNRRGEMKDWWRLAIVVVGLQIPIFWPLWNAPGLREYVQFSWRFEGVLLLIIAVAYCINADRRGFWIMALVGAVTIVGQIRVSNEFILHRPLQFDQYRRDAWQFVPNWAPNDAEEVITIVKNHYYDPPARLLGLTDPTDSVTLITKEAIKLDYRCHLSEAVPVRFHIFYWPYWKLYKDTTELKLVADSNGFATTTLPAGQYNIQLRLLKSKVERTGATISYVGLALLFGLVIFSAVRRSSSKEPGFRK